MKVSVCVIIAAAAMLFTVVPVATAQSNTALLGEPEVSFLTAAIHTAPAIALNVGPGFGLGSYLQGEIVPGIWLTAADVLTLLAAGPAVIAQIQNPATEPTDLQLAGLLVGYASFLGGKIAGVVLPVVHVAREGYDPHNLLSPEFYNLVPGFGIGSLIQGDELGATILGTLDFGAFLGVGVLSFAALSGEMTVANIAGITAYSLFGVSKIFGIVRPFVYEAGRTRTTALQ